MDVGIFYGSTTGTTEAIADQIATHFNNAAVSPVISLDFGDLKKFDLIIFGSSTWGYGDLQDEWEDKIENLKGSDLSGKLVALFGCGDQEGYPDTFVDAIAIIAEAVESAGGKIIGQIHNRGYSFSESKALRGEKLIGLAIDEDNEADLTSGRISDWIMQLRSDLM